MPYLTEGVFGIAEYVREEVAFVQVYVFGCSEKTTRFHKIMGLDMGPWLVLYFIYYFFIFSRENLCNLVVS